MWYISPRGIGFVWGYNHLLIIHTVTFLNMEISIKHFKCHKFTTLLHLFSVNWLSPQIHFQWKILRFLFQINHLFFEGWSILILCITIINAIILLMRWPQTVHSTSTWLTIHLNENLSNPFQNWLTSILYMVHIYFSWYEIVTVELYIQ